MKADDSDELTADGDVWFGLPSCYRGIVNEKYA